MLFGSDRGSFPWREDLNMHEYLYNPANVAQGWRAFVPEAARVSNARTPPSLSLLSSLKFLLFKANMVGLKYEEAR